VAPAPAPPRGEALRNTKMNIVGGDGAFFDRFVKAVTLGQSVDATLENSESLRWLLKDYISGEKSLPEDLKEILSRPGLANDAQSAALAALLAKLAAGREDSMKDKLLAMAEQLTGGKASEKASK